MFERVDIIEKHELRDHVVFRPHIAPALRKRQVHRHRIRAQAEEKRLAERKQAGVAPYQVDADGGDREADIAAQLVDVMRADNASAAERGDDDEEERQECRDGDDAQGADVAVLWIDRIILLIKHRRASRARGRGQRVSSSGRGRRA